MTSNGRGVTAKLNNFGPFWPVKYNAGQYGQASQSSKKNGQAWHGQPGLAWPRKKNSAKS